MAKPPQIRPLRDHEKTLVDCLTPCVDEIRQLYTEFGLRNYRVFLVWVEWTADEDADGLIQAEELDLEDAQVGVGRPRVVREMELLPTPQVSDLTAVAKQHDVTGLTERGGMRVSQISMGYTEDALMGLLPEFRDPQHPESLRPGVEFFWELQEARPPRFVQQGTAGCEAPADARPPRRRFHVSGTPYRRPGKFQWMVNLTRADGERARDGDVGALV